MRAGCAWRLMPSDLPPWETIYRWFAAWRDDGRFERINHALVMADRERVGRDASPSAAIIDSQWDTYIARTIRYAFESSRGKPLSTGQLVKEIYGLQLRVERKPSKSWHYQNVRRALRKVAIPIGRASTRGRSVLWQPDERMGLRDRARHK